MRQIGNERDDRNSGIFEPRHGGGNLRHVGRLEDYSVGSSKPNTVEQLADVLRPHGLGEMEAGPENRRHEGRGFAFECLAHRFGEAFRRLHHHVDGIFASLYLKARLLSLEFTNGCIDAHYRLLTHAPPAVEDAIDGSRTESRLEGDVLDKKRMCHRSLLMAF